MRRRNPGPLGGYTALTALHLVARHIPSNDEIKILIKHGAKLEEGATFTIEGQPTYDATYTPLKAALDVGNYAAVQCLTDAGASIKHINREEVQRCSRYRVQQDLTQWTPHLSLFHNAKEHRIVVSLPQGYDNSDPSKRLGNYNDVEWRQSTEELNPELFELIYRRLLEGSWNALDGGQREMGNGENSHLRHHELPSKRGHARKKQRRGSKKITQGGDNLSSTSRHGLKEPAAGTAQSGTPIHCSAS